MPSSSRSYRNIAEVYEGNVCTAVFEIYPLNAGTPTTSTRFGFDVDSVDELTPMLVVAGAKVIEAPHDSAWGRRAVVEDLDGHRVEIVTPPMPN